MMRSMAASMEMSSVLWESSLGWSGNFGGFQGFEPGDREIGEPDLAHLAALKHPDDDLEQAIVGGEVIRDRTGAAQIIRGNGVGLAHHPHVHYPNTALDQHGPHPPIAGDKP